MARIAAILLLCLAVASARPEFKPFMGFKELHVPASVSPDGRIHKQSFHKYDDFGHALHFEYEVEKDDRVVSLDQDMEIETIKCAKEGLVVEFVSAAAARHHAKAWTAGALLAGGREWGCSHEGSANSHVILRKVIEDGVVRGKELLVRTEYAHYKHMFKNAQIDFSTNMYPGGHFQEIPTSQFEIKQNPKARDLELVEDEDNANPYERRLLWSLWDVGSFVQHAWNDVQDLGERVANVVETVATVVKAITTGDLNVDKSIELYSLSYNLDKSTGKSLGPLDFGASVSCSTCYASMSINLVFGLNVQSYTVDSASVKINGQADLNVQGTIVVQGTVDGSGSKHLTTITMTPITIIIAGVPFVIDLSVPIEGGYKVHGEATASIVSTMRATGSFDFGIAYAQATGFNMIADHSFTKGGGIGDISAGISATAEVYLLPTLVCTIDFIGGPNIAVKPYLELTADFSLNNKCAGGNDTAPSHDPYTGGSGSASSSPNSTSYYTGQYKNYTEDTTSTTASGSSTSTTSSSSSTSTTSSTTDNGNSWPSGTTTSSSSTTSSASSSPTTTSTTDSGMSASSTGSSSSSSSSTTGSGTTYPSTTQSLVERWTNIRRPLSYRQDDMFGNNTKYGLEISLNWGLMVTLGAGVDISVAGQEILKKEIDPIPVYSTKMPISDGCINLGNAEVDVVDGGIYVMRAPHDVGSMATVMTGNIWGGVLVAKAPLPRGCMAHPKPVQIAFQATNQLWENIPFGHEAYVFMGTINGEMPRANGTARCIGAAQYRADIQMDGQREVKLNILTGKCKRCQHERCTSPGPHVALMNLEGMFNEDFSKLSIPSWDRCHSLALMREN